jgi:hypothetical protein
MISAWTDCLKARSEKELLLMYNVENHRIPSFVLNNFVEYRNPIFDPGLRNIKPIDYQSIYQYRFTLSTVPSSIKLWNSLPNDIKERYSEIPLNLILYMTILIVKIIATKPF